MAATSELSIQATTELNRAQHITKKFCDLFGNKIEHLSDAENIFFQASLTFYLLKKMGYEDNYSISNPSIEQAKRIPILGRIVAILTSTIEDSLQAQQDAANYLKRLLTDHKQTELDSQENKEAQDILKRSLSSLVAQANFISSILMDKNLSDEKRLEKITHVFSQQVRR